MRKDKQVADSLWIAEVQLFNLKVALSSPYGAGEQWIESVQPVVHLFVIGGLQQDPSVLSAHSKRVGSLRTQP